MTCSDGRANGSIVGFCGFKGSGKSTAAQCLNASGYVLHALAEPIKRAMMALGVSAKHLTDPKLKEEPIDLLCDHSPRYAMQTLGTDWGRELLGEELWLRVWETTCPKGPVIVDDVRFVNEAVFLRERGARLYRIERPGCRGDSHISERAHLEIPVDGVIVNDGMHEDLVARIEETLGLAKETQWFRERGHRSLDPMRQ